MKLIILNLQEHKIYDDNSKVRSKQKIINIVIW